MDRDLPEIEKLFKQTLQDDEEMPDAKVWEAIDHVLDKDNILKIEKKYNNLKKISFLLFFMLLVVGVYEFNKKSNTSRNSEVPKEVVSRELIPSGSKAISGEATKTSIQDNRITAGKSIPNNPVSLARSNGDINSSKENAVITSSRNSTSTTKERNSMVSFLQKGGRNLNRGAAVAKNKLAATDFENDLFDKNLNKKPVFENDDSFYEPAPTTVNLHSVSFIQNVPDHLPKKSSLLGENKSPSVNTGSFKTNQPSPFSISFYFSPELASYHLQDNIPNNNVDDVLQIEKKEHHKSSISAGALINYRFTKFFGFETGLQYLNTNITLDPTTIYAGRDNTGDIKYLVNVSSGRGYMLPSFSSNPNIGDSLYAYAATHTLKYITLPLNLKYYFNTGRLSANVMAGVGFNLLINGKLKTYVENATEQELETVNKLEGLKNLYLTGSLGLGMDYMLNKKVAIWLHPTYRFALNSINKNASVNSFPTSAGLMIGLSYGF